MPCSRDTSHGQPLSHLAMTWVGLAVRAIVMGFCHGPHVPLHLPLPWVNTYLLQWILLLLPKGLLDPQANTKMTTPVLSLLPPHTTCTAYRFSNDLFMCKHHRLLHHNLLILHVGRIKNSPTWNISSSSSSEFWPACQVLIYSLPTIKQQYILLKYTFPSSESHWSCILPSLSEYYCERWLGHSSYGSQTA